MTDTENINAYPVAQTGGRGYNFEDKVATYFLLLMIEGRCLLEHEFGYITKVDWQTSSDGWLLDDLCLTLKDHANNLHHIAIWLRNVFSVNSPNQCR